MDNNNYYYCGININNISGLVSVIHIFDNIYYYHGDKKLSSVKTLKIFNNNKNYDYFFPINQSIFEKFYDYDFKDLKQKQLQKIIKDFSLEEWIL
jgi:hypothetical protein